MAARDRAGVTAADHVAAADRIALAAAIRPVVARFLALAGVRTGEVVVDSGCGAGLLTFAAAAAAGPTGRVYGVEADAGLLAVARARVTPRVGWLRADRERLPFGSHTVDRVLANAVEPGERGAAVLAECARVLMPGGRVVAAAWDVGGNGVGDGGVGDALAALAWHGVRAVGGTVGGAASGTGALDVLVDGAGLSVGYQARDDVTIGLAGGRAEVVVRVEYVTATAGRT